MIKFVPTRISDCYQIEPKIVEDERGRFVKTFHKDIFDAKNLESHFREEYYTASRQRVLRGLHFQLPPKDHAKLVYCVSGEVIDAVVDLRLGSPTFGQHHVCRLSVDNAMMMYIPSGMAHGFYVTGVDAILIYKVTATYSPEHDSGILWSSVGIQWPDQNPIISGRDRGFVPLDSFVSPFVYQEDKNGQ